ncbi:MAG TPA: hypothetical protein VMZ51_08250 [Acidimicrobiales bacterium]|nr:hypothetical protein [Acidimicrobiales bacterium]
MTSSDLSSAATVDLKALRAIKPALKAGTDCYNGSVLIDGWEDHLTLTTANGDATIVATLPVTDTDGTLTGQRVSVRVNLADIPTTGPSSRWTISAEGLEVESNGITQHLAPAEPPYSGSFPTHYGPVPTTTTLASSTLAAVAVAASKDQARPILTSMLFSRAGVVATDSYRLHYAPGVDFGDVLIPAALVAVVAKYGDTLGVGVSEAGDLATLAAGPVVATVRTIDGEFPDWAQLIPKVAGKVTNLCDGPGLAKAAAAAFKITKRPGDIRHTLPARLNGALTVEVEGTEVFRAPLPTTGDDLAVAFNPRFLGEVVAATGATEIHWVDALKPAVFAGPGPVRGLLMPVRVD